MNAPGCLAPDQVDQALGLPPDHPQSRHVRECPRCSALVLEYRDFLAASEVPAGADPADATRRLSGAIADLVQGAPTAARTVESRRAPSLLGRIAAWWAGPAWRPAVAFAALAVVTVTWWSMRDRAPAEDVLRGGDSAARPLLELRAVAVGDEALALGWSAVPGAALYSVTLLSPTLEPVAELPLTADTSASLSRAQWPAAAAGDTLFVRIDALRDAQIVAVSALHPIVLSR